MTDSKNSQDLRRPASVSLNTSGQSRLNSLTSGVKTSDSAVRPSPSPRQATSAPLTASTASAPLRQAVPRPAGTASSTLTSAQTQRPIGSASILSTTAQMSRTGTLTSPLSSASTQISRAATTLTGGQSASVPGRTFSYSGPQRDINTTAARPSAFVSSTPRSAGSASLQQSGASLSQSSAFTRSSLGTAASSTAASVSASASQRSAYTPSSRLTTSAPLSRSSVPEVSRTPLSSATTGEARATFTPSTFPGANALSIEAQRVGYARVMSNNPDAVATSSASLSSNSRIVTDMQYRRFAAYLEDQSGIVLGEGKQYLVNSRLSPLLNRFKVTTVDDLINKAMEPNRYKDISSAVIDAMTTNETLWFRDTYPYLALKNMILPELANKRKNPVRIWSAACSSGQEPFSIAMVVQEQAAQMVHVDPAQTQIVGTDISPEMLERCRHGLYDSHALARGLSAERKAKFFKPTNDPNQMKIDDKIKQMCIFKHMNLLSSYALLGKFDVIFCRNVLIYFNNDVKSQILNKFALSLNPGGYLILGSSESMSGLTDKYEMVRCNPGLAYRLKA